MRGDVGQVSESICSDSGGQQQAAELGRLRLGSGKAVQGSWCPAGTLTIMLARCERAGSGSAEPCEAA